MKIHEFSHKSGFGDYRDFIAEAAPGAEETDFDVFTRLGFDKWDELFSQQEMQWVVTYKNDESSAGFTYIISIENNADVEYIVCRSFVDYLEFMHRYLPTLREMNAASMECHKQRQ